MEQPGNSKHSKTSGTKIRLRVIWQRKIFFGISILPELLTLVESRKDWSKLQEIHDCNLGQRKPRRRGAQHNYVSCRANSQRKTPDSSKWRPWRFDSAHIKSFLARTRERESTIHAFQWTLPWPEKIIQYGSSICRHDLENLDTWISSTMEWEIKVVRRTCMKSERKRFCVGGRWFSEKMWNKMGRIIKVFKGDDGVVRWARVIMAHGQINRPVVKLAPVFYDGVSEI